MFTSELVVFFQTLLFKLLILCTQFQIKIKMQIQFYFYFRQCEFSRIFYSKLLDTFCFLKATFIKLIFYLIWFGFFFLVGAWVWTRVGLKIINYQKKKFILKIFYITNGKNINQTCFSIEPADLVPTSDEDPKSNS